MEPISRAEISAPVSGDTVTEQVIVLVAIYNRWTLHCDAEATRRDAARARVRGFVSRQEILGRTRGIYDKFMHIHTVSSP